MVGSSRGQSRRPSACAPPAGQRVAADAALAVRRLLRPGRGDILLPSGTAVTSRRCTIPWSDGTRQTSPIDVAFAHRVWSGDAGGPRTRGTPGGGLSRATGDCVDPTGACTSHAHDWGNVLGSPPHPPTMRSCSGATFPPETRSGRRSRPAPSSATRFSRHIRGRYLLAIDLVGIVVAAYVALALRFDRISGPIMVPVFPVVVGPAPRGPHDHQHPARACTADAGASPASPSSSGSSSPPRSGRSSAWSSSTGPRSPATGPSPTASRARSGRIELLLSVAILGGVRFGIRAAAEARPRPRAPGPPVDRPTLLYGAGHAGVLMARSALRYPGSGVRAGRVPRRRPEPGGRHRRRAPRLRWPRVDGAGRRGDGRADAADHDAERARGAPSAGSSRPPWPSTSRSARSRR